MFWNMYDIRSVQYPDQLNETAFCQLDRLAAGIPLAIYGVVHHLSDVANDTAAALYREKDSILIVTLVLVVLCCLPAIAFLHVVVARTTQRLVEALRSVPPDGARAATFPLLKDTPTGIFAVPEHLPELYAARVLAPRILFTIFVLLVIALQLSPSYVLANAGRTLVAMRDLMASGSQRHPLCAELWGVCAMALIQKTHPLPFTHRDDLGALVVSLQQYDELYLAGISEISETYGAAKAARSPENCQSITCTGEIPYLAEFIDGVLELFHGDYTFRSREFGSVTRLVLLEIDPAMAEIPRCPSKRRRGGGIQDRQRRCSPGPAAGT
jgi:hypothetical protein